MIAPYGQPVRGYVTVVTLAGIALFAFAVSRPAVAISLGTPTFWVLSLFVVGTELFPISIQRRDGETDEITTSTTFGFALLLASGSGVAALSFGVASLVGDLIHRKPAWKALFNVAQYTIAIVAAGAVYAALAEPGAMTAGKLPAVLASAVVFFVVNTLLTSIALALALHLPLLAYVARDLFIQSYTAPALLALAPIVVLAADVSLWFVPLLAIPIGAVYWGATVALENVKLVERLRGSLEHMTELNQAKEDFVAVVSHELRTPLTSIQGYLKTVLQLRAELDEAQQEAFLRAADRQGDRLKRLIEQLLVIGRLESHVEPLTLSSLSIHQLTANVVEELRERAAEHSFDIRVEPNLPPVETDEGKVHQILSNLVENALKYSPPRTRVTVRGELGLKGVVLAVEDEGLGIPEDAREQVFDRFFQVDSSATRTIGGTGLGLYICRRMAESIGARVWLDRSGATGSVFCLFIPLTPETGETETGETETGETETAQAETDHPSADGSQSMTASV